jgi:hypothetical protein
MGCEEWSLHERKNVYNILVRKPVGKKYLRRPGQR